MIIVDHQAHPIGYAEAVALVGGMAFVGLAGNNGRQRGYIVLIAITVSLPHRIINTSPYNLNLV